MAKQKKGKKLRQAFNVPIWERGWVRMVDGHEDGYWVFDCAGQRIARFIEERQAKGFVQAVNENTGW